MARPSSRQVAGYFPTPKRLLSSFASTLAWSAERVNPILVDPCAGTGEAIATLRDLWAARFPRLGRAKIFAAELEAERARELAATVSEPQDATFHGDAFALAAKGAWPQGATVLFLNPPYDSDPIYQRLEHRFLAHTAPWLADHGALMLVIPVTALAACAPLLAQQFRGLRAYRFPEPEWHDFHQILLLGWRTRDIFYEQEARDLLRSWTDDPMNIPVLPEAEAKPLMLYTSQGDLRGFDLALTPMDLQGVLDAYRPFEGQALGLDRPVSELLGAPLGTAMPPKPAHVALALSSGMFNGHKLLPNDPRHHPAVLAKGSLRRAYTLISERRSNDGEVTAVVELENPTLDVTLLRLDTYTFHPLSPGTEPTGNPELDRWNIADLLIHYDRSLTQVLERQFPALHRPTDPAAQLPLPTLARTPFRMQAQAVQALVKLIASGQNPFLIGEVGTGKTTMALLVAAALAPRAHATTTEALRAQGFTSKLPIVRRLLVFCPPHLVSSWAKEVHAVLPEARVVTLRKVSDLEQDGEVFLLSRETAKLGYRVAGLHGRCPGCGAKISRSATENAEQRARCTHEIRRPANAAARFGFDLEAGARWEVRVCNEPLFFAKPPRRVPLSKVILRKYRRKFDLVAIDEAHEANHSDSAQAKAAHRLARLPGVPTLVLTGSLMGGYASHLFANLHALSPRFQAEFGRDELEGFVGRYGFRKILRRLDTDQRRRGSCSDRELEGRRVIGEAPGIMPTCITRHLLPHSVFVHKADLDLELPPLSERPITLSPDPQWELDRDLFKEAARLERLLLQRIKDDQRDPLLAGKLFGALGQLPSYLDRATDDLPPFVLAYPDGVGGNLVAEAVPLPATYRTPKERWLLDQLRSSLASGEKVLLFLSHTGAAELPRRILRLVEEVAPGAVFLDARKVAAEARQDWIDEHVIRPGVPVLIVNPNAVRTGLNNLVSFSTAIWYELDPSALTYRQANGRLHRIGQTRPVTIHVPFYDNTAQAIAFELLGQKVSASLKVDGLDVGSALEAAGAGDDPAPALAAALSIGQALYERLTRR